jgi:hypothetical protein
MLLALRISFMPLLKSIHTLRNKRNCILKRLGYNTTVHSVKMAINRYYERAVQVVQQGGQGQ